jgi:hypothetical protein
MLSQLSNFWLRKKQEQLVLILSAFVGIFSIIFQHFISHKKAETRPLVAK